jgi:hypothetical protein
MHRAFLLLLMRVELKTNNQYPIRNEKGYFLLPYFLFCYSILDIDYYF